MSTSDSNTSFKNKSAEKFMMQTTKLGIADYFAH